jgi:hypothetical protein
MAGMRAALPQLQAGPGLLVGSARAFGEGCGREATFLWGCAACARRLDARSHAPRYACARVVQLHKLCWRAPLVASLAPRLVCAFAP